MKTRPKAGFTNKINVNFPSISHKSPSYFTWYNIIRNFLLISWTTTTPLSLGLVTTTATFSSNIDISKNSDILKNINTMQQQQQHQQHHEQGQQQQFSDVDQKFFDRISSSIKTVQSWENDTTLLQKCRAEIPWDELWNANGTYSHPHDRMIEGNALVLQRLCRWFQKSMKWVNNPPCTVCGCKETEMTTVRGPETEEEIEGNAKRVEGKEMSKWKWISL